MATIQEVTQQHKAAIAANAALGVRAYDVGAPQAKDRVWRVREGITRRGGQVLGPGHLFHPTEREVANRAKAAERIGNTEDTKYEEVSAAELSAVMGTRAQVAGADIGLRALPMTDDALKAALDAKLDEADFADVKPEGSGGKFTRAQVRAIAAAKSVAS